MIAFCRDARRRDLVLSTPNLNGIDYLEVLGAPGCGRVLALTFLKDARGLGLGANNVALTGDTTLTLNSIQAATSDDPFTVTLTLGQTGDFSPYTLTLVTNAQADDPDVPVNTDPPPGIDPQLASVQFSFKSGCPSQADCLSERCCPSSPLTPPDIHYLARDYDGFRQAMLDRMAVLLPDWTEAHAADPGITLVEALAYAADRVSYVQDAINTEAYIGTARSRISLSRHARLVDYTVQQGTNARAWVCVLATALADLVTIPAGTQVFPLVPGLAPAIDPNSYAASVLQTSARPVFESLADLVLHAEQTRMDLYTWGDGQCCLPIGTTQATLKGTFPNLVAGSVLIFEEVIGPLTGDPADADPTHRWAVRLTQSGRSLLDPVNGISLTNITWEDGDALPFALCLSSVTDANHGSLPLAGVSVAQGNVMAVDQGVWTINESLGVVPPAPVAPVAGGCNCGDTAGALIPRPRYQPVLANQPLTFAVDYDPGATASTFLAPDTSTAQPQITLAGDDGTVWTPASDLLEADDKVYGFVPEIEADGTAHLRFGDGTYGAAPEAGLAVTATYRTGNGAAGNVGREALAHLLFAAPGIIGVRNPLAAAGGVDAETMEHIRQVAPFSFQTQLRCVTPDDYGNMAETLAGVSEAKGTIRWTGSWYTAFTSIDPTAPSLTTTVKSAVTTTLNTLRMMGTDLVVEGAKLVGLRIALEICVAPNQFQGDVCAAVWQVLVTGDSCAGTLGLLNPANFQFGETVYASPVIAAAQAVVGVVAVRLVTFERMDAPAPAGSAPPTQITLGRLEIPRCDNDLNHADRGLLVLTPDGGK